MRRGVRAHRVEAGWLLRSPGHGRFGSAYGAELASVHVQPLPPRVKGPHSARACTCHSATSSATSLDSAPAQRGAATAPRFAGCCRTARTQLNRSQASSVQQPQADAQRPRSAHVAACQASLQRPWRAVKRQQTLPLVPRNTYSSTHLSEAAATLRAKSPSRNPPGDACTRTGSCNDPRQPRGEPSPSDHQCVRRTYSSRTAPPNGPGCVKSWLISDVQGSALRRTRLGCNYLAHPYPLPSLAPATACTAAHLDAAARRPRQASARAGTPNCAAGLYVYGDTRGSDHATATLDRGLATLQ